MKQHVFENSSQVKCIRYFDDKQILEVEYKTNKTYQYFNVPETIYEAAMAAESIGKYVNKYVKNEFKYQLLPF